MLPYKTRLRFFAYNKGMSLSMTKKKLPGFSRRFEMALSVNESSGLINANEKSYFDKPGRELGDIFGVTKKTISNWRKLDVAPSGIKCIEICEKLNVEFRWLFTGLGEMRNTDKSLGKLFLNQVYDGVDNDAKAAIISAAVDIANAASSVKISVKETQHVLQFVKD